MSGGTSPLASSAPDETASRLTQVELAQTEPGFDRLTETWDAVVVGAGPAGGVAALRLAERGHRVLLVESKSFPRPKVCGGCLNRRAWSVLAASALTDAVQAAGAIELERMHLICGSRSMEWTMPKMHALSRFKLDEIIAGRAVERGAVFLHGTHARIRPAGEGAKWIFVQLKHRSGQTAVVKARVALAADGLAHSSLSEHPEAASQIAPHSRIGLGTNLLYDGAGYPVGRLTMVVGRSGYVGITRVEQGRLNLAAALTASSLRTAEGTGSAAAGHVIAAMLDDAGLEVPPGLQPAQWCGTPQLTRESRRWSGRRLFLVGDSASYVEPFTGEGMSWALAGGHEVCQYAELAISDWSDSLANDWHLHWRRRVRGHQTICRGLAWLLRHARLAEAALGTAAHAPWLTSWIMQRVAGAGHEGRPT